MTELTSIRPALIALRVKHGADTPPGHTLSDLVGEFEARDFAKATNNAFQLRKLAQLMPDRVGRLEMLTQQRG